MIPFNADPLDYTIRLVLYIFTHVILDQPGSRYLSFSPGSMFESRRAEPSQGGRVRRHGRATNQRTAVLLVDLQVDFQSSSSAPPTSLNPRSINADFGQITVALTAVLLLLLLLLLLLSPLLPHLHQLLLPTFHLLLLFLRLLFFPEGLFGFSSELTTVVVSLFNFY